MLLSRSTHTLTGIRRFCKRQSGGVCSALLLAGIGLPLAAQVTSSNPSTNAAAIDRHTENSNWPFNDTTAAAHRKVQVPVCSLEPFPGIPDTVSVADLRVPEKAQNEYQKACTAFQQKHLPQTEQHLRKALDIYPAYARGWVMLGAILGTEQQMDEARVACARAVDTDASAWDGYLCLSELSGREQRWAESLSEGNRAVELSAASRPYAYYFNAVALFNLNLVNESEKQAMQAAELDRKHQRPAIHLLLARICESRQDHTAAAGHLREFLRYAQDSPQSRMAKEELAQLEQEGATP
ncbi:MAG TPA: hypothetical protein VGR96_12180 [Acidobacteriaceae bacterium]|nr:hypothetical protein [Acidobacteriaceae bacterium]